MRAVNGVSLKGYTLFSPSLVRHYLMHYGALAKCTGTPASQTVSTSDDPQGFATCLGQPFPNDAVAIKATYDDPDVGVATFDTSAQGLQTMMVKDARSWSALPVPLVNLTPDLSYTASTFLDDHKTRTFHLTGMHIITKEIPNWMWVSLWWSPTPNQDFGGDRPDSVTRLGSASGPGVWANYKMCVATDFKEGDASLISSDVNFSDASVASVADPSLRAALAAAYHYNQPNSFCSNPYIESKGGFAPTNCIGCHQYSGPAASGREAEAGFSGRISQNFMADFLWSFDDISESFRDSVVWIMNTKPAAGTP